MYKKVLFLLLIFCAVYSIYSQDRSFKDFFPDFNEEEKEQVFTPEGITITSEKNTALKMLSPVLSSFNIPQYLSKKKPSFLVESLIVVPFTSPVPNLLAVYNSLSRIRDLKGRLYRSFTRNADVPLFENAMRLESERKLNAIPDPPPASSLPSAETNYILLKDINFGNSYYRAELSVERPGLVYTLTNFKTLSYLFIPVIRENKFFTQFYIEPIEEGVLLYCVAGADVSDFVARKVDIPSAIEKRIRVIMDWIIDGFQ